MKRNQQATIASRKLADASRPLAAQLLKEVKRLEHLIFVYEHRLSSLPTTCLYQLVDGKEERGNEEPGNEERGNEEREKKISEGLEAAEKADKDLELAKKKEQKEKNSSFYSSRA